MPVIPDGYAQANWIFSGFGAPTGAQVTMGFDLGAYTGSAADLAEALYGAAEDSWLQSLASAIFLESVLVKFGPAQTGESGEFSGSTAGGDTSAQSGPQVAFLVQKQTAQGGRAGRGRWYLPGVTEPKIDNSGTIEGASYTQIQNNLDEFYGLVTAGDFTPVVLHGVNSPISTPSPITSLVLSPDVASQRHRMRR